MGEGDGVLEWQQEDDDTGVWYADCPDGLSRWWAIRQGRRWQLVREARNWMPYVDWFPTLAAAQAQAEADTRP